MGRLQCRMCVCLYGHAVFQDSFTEHHKKSGSIKVLQYLSDVPVSLNLFFHPTTQHIADESLQFDVCDIDT